MKIYFKFIIKDNNKRKNLNVTKIILTFNETRIIVISIKVVLIKSIIGKSMNSFFLNQAQNNQKIDNQTKFWGLWSAFFVLCLILQSFGLFHLSASYHLFADERSVCGVKYGLDVFSNLSFLIVGFFACLKYKVTNNKNLALWITALGAMLVCFGSSYYHMSPSDSRLVWDRLPMALVFAGIMSYSIIQLNLISFVKNKNAFTWSYLIFSLGCVFFWYLGTIIGFNGLAPYVFLQFGGLALLVYMGYIAYKEKKTSLVFKIAALISLYTVAKFFETYDSEVFSYTNLVISGHTIKHFISAVALYVWLFKE
jgi:hypothetical protein